MKLRRAVLQIQCAGETGCATYIKILPSIAVHICHCQCRSFVTRLVGNERLDGIVVEAVFAVVVDGTDLSRTLVEKQGFEDLGIHGFLASIPVDGDRGIGLRTDQFSHAAIRPGDECTVDGGIVSQSEMEDRLHR